MEAEQEYNNTWNPRDYTPNLLERNLINSFTCVVCIFGLVGNGTVIWLLGFCMKRNPFTTYILNLAVADFGVLISLNLRTVCDIIFYNFGIFPPWWNSYIDERDLFEFAYTTSQFLLTAISIDKCVSVLFPLWYRCQRPLNWSSTVCAILWVLCLLLSGLRWILPVKEDHVLPLFYVFLVTTVVCLPLITVSTLVLFIRVCFKPQQRQRGKLLTVILLTLFFFFLLAFPIDVIYLVTYHTVHYTYYVSVIFRYFLHGYGFLCASLNSFVNPLIYFLVGRKKRSPFRQNMKLILQRIFKDEEVSGENCNPRSDICISLDLSLL